MPLRRATQKYDAGDLRLMLPHIYTDGRKHPADLKPSYNGHSTGHWESGALVIDTIGLNGRTWLDRPGHPESTQMHITERIHRVDSKTLQVDFTFDDAKTYTKPWTAQIRLQLHPIGLRKIEA